MAGHGEVIVGVDGGNTKTIALVCDAQGSPLGTSRGGCSNWEQLGEERAARAILDIIGEALAQSGRTAADVRHVHMGLAGQDWPDDEPPTRDALVAAGWRSGLSLENDGFLAIRAGAPEGYGIGVTAGTGICGAIIRPDGDRFLYGAFTDLGGGSDIDGDVIQAVIRAEDGRGAPTALTGAVLAATGHASVRDLVYALHRTGYHPDRGPLRRALFTASNAGDPVAVDIVTRFGTELALCGTNLIRRWRLAEEDPAVVASGSLFMRTGPLLFDVFRREVLAAAPRARVSLTALPPVLGAARGALGACGWDTPEAWERLNREVADRGWFTGENDVS